MKKLWMLAVLLIATSCNDKLWEELERVDLINTTQANELFKLRQRNAELEIMLEEAYAELQDLIDDVSVEVENNAETLIELNTDITENAEEILNIISQVDSLETSTSAEIDRVENLISETNDLINEEVSLLEEYVDNGLENLQSQLDTIQPVVNNIYNSVTNIQYDDTQLQEDVRELFCDTEEEVANYVLPEWNNETNWIGIYEDNTKVVLIDSIKRVQFGEYPNWTFRHYDENGWLGVFGTNYNEMELPEYSYDKTYQESLSLEPYSEEANHPSLGEIVELEDDTENEIAFEFNKNTGEYKGCSDVNAVWYVNGVEVDEGANVRFNVGKLKGDYIITVKLTEDSFAQHVVTKDITSKVPKIYGKVKGKVKKKVIV